MKAETRNKLFEAWAYCDEEDKSTEFMIQYMQDIAEVDLDCVLNFIDRKSDLRQQWYKENPDWINNPPKTFNH